MKSKRMEEKGKESEGGWKSESSIGKSYIIRAYCYAKLAISFLVLAVIITGTYYPE